MWKKLINKIKSRNKRKKLEELEDLVVSYLEITRYLQEHDPFYKSIKFK